MTEFEPEDPEEGGLAPQGIEFEPEAEDEALPMKSVSSALPPEAVRLLGDEVIAYLDSVLEVDPQVVHALLVNRVPTERLASHPHFPVISAPVVDGYFADALGLLNGFLYRLGAHVTVPKIENRRLVGFQLFAPEDGVTHDSKEAGDGGRS
jgi:hypothetical protein